MKLNRLFLGLPLFLALHSSALAHRGVITNFHLNSGIPDRGVCIQMSPTLPETGWACLYKTNPLYKETTATLLAAYAGGKSCTVSVDAKGNEGYWRIDHLSCH